MPYMPPHVDGLRPIGTPGQNDTWWLGAPLVEGPVTKGGHNPPYDGIPRPPAPMGSGVYDQYPVSESPAMQSVLRGIEQATRGEYQPDPTEPETPRHWGGPLTDPEFLAALDRLPVSPIQGRVLPTKSEHSGRCPVCRREPCPACGR